MITRLPDFMGVWKTVEGRVSPFFLYIDARNEEEQKGTIEDELGTATFEGTFKPEGISFEKRYFNKPEEPLFYATTLAIGKGFEGSYRFNTSDAPKAGDFYIEPYRCSHTLDCIASTMRERNLRQ